MRTPTDWPTSTLRWKAMTGFTSCVATSSRSPGSADAGTHPRPDRGAGAGQNRGPERMRGGVAGQVLPGMRKSAPVSTSPVLDLADLRRGCAHCSLQQLCLPAGIGPSELRKLDDIVRRRRPVERGECLFRAGDAMHAVYVARDGAFKTVTISEEGEEQVVGFHLAGELIGLDALGTGEHRCEAIALTTANVCEVPFDQLAHVAAQVPSLQQQLLRVMGRSVSR